MNKMRKNGAGVLQPVFEVPVERIGHEVLSNGMHILVFKNTSLPKVLVQIAYDVGSSIEDSGERGLAHLIEHMIFKGTEKLSETDIDTIARKYGASFNASTSMDVTTYYFETNKNNWKPFLSILADCMQNAKFDDQHLSSEVKAVIQELKMIKDDYVRSMLFKALELSFPANHPYHVPTIGFKEDLLGMNAENLKTFYKKYYRPDRATLFIVGDVDIDEAVRAAKDQFEHLRADQKSVTKPFPVVIPELMTHHTRYFEDVKQPQVGFYWTIPGLKSTQDEQVASVIDSVLGWGQSGRLYHVLVDEKKLAASVYVKALKFFEAGIFLIFIEPMPGKTDECERIIKQELENVIVRGVTKEELERVVKTKSKNFFQKMQSFSDFVYDWIESYFVTHDELDVFNRVERYKKIDSAQVMAFAKKHLDPFFMNRIEVLPLPEAKKELRESIKRMTNELDQKILSLHQRTEVVEEPRAANGFAAPAPLQFEFPKPTKTVALANGLKVLLAPNKNIPLISINFMFKDAWYLQEAREGISVEVMMDMLMEGSSGYNKKDHVDFFESLGASYAFDAQGARFTCLRDDFSKLLDRLYLILSKPTFPRESLEKIKHIMIDENQRAKDSPKSMAVRLLKNAVYKNHPFSWTYNQAIETIKTIDAEKLKALHNTFLNPANMVAAVVGDFDVDAMVDTLKKSLNVWPAGSRKTLAATKRSFDDKELIDHKMIRDQVMLLFGQPSSVTIYNPDFIPLKLLNIICFRSLGSRIYKLREQTGLFYTAMGAWAAGATRDGGFDYVGMIVNPENAATAEEQTRQLLTQLAHDGVTKEEIAAACQMYLKDLIDIVADNGSIAYMLCMLDAFELGFDYYDTVLARVQTMSVEEINAIAAKYCTHEAMARVRVGPVK